MERKTSIWSLEIIFGCGCLRAGWSERTSELIRCGCLSAGWSERTRELIWCGCVSAGWSDRGHVSSSSVAVSGQVGRTLRGQVNTLYSMVSLDLLERQNLGSPFSHPVSAVGKIPFAICDHTLFYCRETRSLVPTLPLKSSM